MQPTLTQDQGHGGVEMGREDGLGPVGRGIGIGLVEDVRRPHAGVDSDAVSEMARNCSSTHGSPERSVG